LEHSGARSVIAHQNSGILLHFAGIALLNHFRHNKTALIRRLHKPSSTSPFQVPLSLTYPESFTLKASQSRICGDWIAALVYTSPHRTDFFTTAAGIPRTLSQFPALIDNRHFKPCTKAQRSIRGKEGRMVPTPLSENSPILLIDNSSKTN